MSFEILRLMAQEYADQHKEPQALPAPIDTMAYAYQRICQGEDPWTALGDFQRLVWLRQAHPSKPDQRSSDPTRAGNRTDPPLGGFLRCLCRVLCVNSFSNPARSGCMIPTMCWKCPGGTRCDHLTRMPKHTSEQSHRHHLLAATSFAVTGSTKINMKCTNGSRKPSSRA